MTPEPTASCAHEACACAVPATESFCSEYCRTHTDDAPCHCGHPHCGAHADPQEPV